MRKSIVLCVLAATLAWAASGRASVLFATAADPSGLTLANTGDFTLASGYPGGSTNASLTLTGTQTETVGSLYVVVTPSSSSDPTFGTTLSVDNNTSFAWGGYDVQLSMPVDFVISGPPQTEVTAPGDWSTNIVQPTQVGPNWVGQVNYSAGTPIALNGELDFGYTVSFTGLPSYQVDATYTAVPVPEPGTLGLLLAGLSVAALLGRRAKRLAV